MNIAIRKLAILEKSLLEREEAVKLDGYVTSPIDPVFKDKVTRLMDKIRVLYMLLNLQAL